MPPRLHHAVPTAIASTTLIAIMLAAWGPGPALAAEPWQAAAEVDAPSWPRVFTREGTAIILHEPQVDAWSDFESIQFRAAVEVAENGGPSHIGAINVLAKTRIDKTERVVLLTEPQSVVLFPESSGAEATRLANLVEELLPNRSSIEVGLDRLLAHVDSPTVEAMAVEVNMEPPTIFFSAEPAELLVFLGAPRLQPIDGTPLQFVINTNWDVIYDPATQTYFVLQDDAWVSAKDVTKGPFQPVRTLPGSFAGIPDEANWAEVRAAMPARSAGRAPYIFASNEPAELIVTNGPVTFTPIAGTSLQQVVNTDVPLIYAPITQTYYFLVAGRWFSTKSLEGGHWTAATFDLPPDFAKIPEEGDLGFVLVSVPGTEQAEMAAEFATIPQRATVNRSDVTVKVSYDGEPAFVDIESTPVKYAVNTTSDVFVVDEKYYCCHQGIWFVAVTATGTWSVCDDVPQAIYSIPASSPKHNVTYVTVHESTPETVTVESTSGYTGELLVAGLVVFGAALVIDELLEDDDHWHCHHYHSGSYSYGCGAVYHHGHGGYYRAATRNGPHGGARAGAVYNPDTGGWARGGARYGPSGAAFAREGYNPWTDTYAARAGGATPYGSWSRGVAVRDDEWARGSQANGIRGSAGWVESSSGAGAVRVDRRGSDQRTVARDSEGNVYVGNDGNVHRRTDNGEWESRQNGEWEQAERNRTERTQSEPTRTERERAGERSTDRSGTGDRTSERGRASTGQRDVRQDLDRQARNRDKGNRRTQSVQRSRRQPMRGSGGRSRGGRR
ncbi:MAG: hypothetical protein ACYTGR_05175 [Planctomycetota bacterium]|jgi:hypothetical protein